MRTLRASLIVLAATAAVPAHADPDLWFSDSGGRLGRIDVATGELTSIGTMSQVMTDLAFSPEGELFGTTFDQLFRIDTATAGTTLVGNHANAQVNSLVFGANGTLYAAGSTLYTLDRDDGSAAAVGPVSFQSSGDLAFVGGTLYLSALSGLDNLVQIDPANGAGTLVGSIGRGSVFGLASPNGSDLYGMSFNQVFAIDPATGAAGPTLQDFSQNGFSQVFGTTFFEEALPPPPPIPEPSTAALVGLGLAALALHVRIARRPDPHA